MLNKEQLADTVSRGPYTFSSDHVLTRAGKEEDTTITNFRALITDEMIYHDGREESRRFKISAAMTDLGELIHLNDAEISASQLESDSWVTTAWGCRAIVFPVANAARDLATAMKMISRPKRTDVYQHTGWTTIRGSRVYISNGGGIGPKGHMPEVLVELPTELAGYRLPAPKPDREAVIASLMLTSIGPPEIMWPLYAATYRAAVGMSDFSLHLAGRTGTFKSEVCSLFQSHYGEAMTARRLPGSWSSTDNALELLAFRAAHALFVIDDFVPQGTTYDVKKLNAKADRLFRAQGNQQGRQRLTDTSTMQGTNYPRGIILSTGEDIPDGHSVRGRMVILELSPGEVPADRLSAAQGDRPKLPHALADWIHWLAEEDRGVEERRTRLRDTLLGIGHTRTPSMIADLLATIEMLGEWWTDRKYFTADKIAELQNAATAAITKAAEEQIQYLTQSDPVEAFIAAIRHILSNNVGHLKSQSGGIPKDAQRYGWTEGNEKFGDMPSYTAKTTRIGWVNSMKGEVYIEPGLLPTIAKYSGGKLAVTEGVLLKRLKEAGVLSRVDSTRARNTVRITAEGQSRNVIAIAMGSIFEDDHTEEEDSNEPR